MGRSRRFERTLRLSPEQQSLFQLPDGVRVPGAQVIILTGPSGSGKTSLSSQLGIPSLSLDHFYRDGDDPQVPLIRPGIHDWDDPASWDQEAALACLIELCLTGSSEIPIYDIPTNRKTGSRPFALGENRLVIAEGIFASRLVAPLLEEGLLADALCIARSPIRNAWFRLMRDLAEGRKPLPVLLHRGIRLAREEPGKIKQWKLHGCRPVSSLQEASASINLLRHRLRLQGLSKGA